MYTIPFHAMTKYGESKSFAEAKTTNRGLAARQKPASGEPGPGDLGGDKRALAPAVLSGGSTNSILDRGSEGAASTSLIFVPCTGRDESLRSPRQGHTRRRYDLDERLEVAETRRRGACPDCRASKIKCKHAPTFQIHQIQSHERFALGLTTPSLTENRDEHKHVMEEKIAEFDNTLVKAQENTSKEKGVATSGETLKAAAEALALSPPNTSTPKIPSSQKSKQPPKVCHGQAQPPLADHFKKGLHSFKLYDGLKEGQKRKRGKPPQTKEPQAKEGSSTGMTNSAPGPKHAATRKIPPTIVCQHPSIDSVLTASPEDQAKPARTVISGHSSSHSREVHGCIALQESVVGSGLKPPLMNTLESRLPLVTPRKVSGSSDKDSHATTRDGSMLSYGRSQSPSSDHLPSEPPAFVHLSDVVLRFSFENFLYGDKTPSPDEVYFPHGSEGVNIRSLAAFDEIPKDDERSMTGMDLDDDL